MTMTIALPKVTPIAPFGCEITGVDFSADLPPEVKAAIRKAWVEHGVAVFPEAIHNNDAHVRLSWCFGEPQPAVTKKLNTDENPFMMILDYDPAKSDHENVYEVDGVTVTGWLGWHWDQAFVPEIVRAGCLRITAPAKELGLTGFINGGDAYDRLSQKMQDRIEDLQVVYHFEGAQEKNRFGFPFKLKLLERSPEKNAALEKYYAAFPPVVHPLVIRLPENGRTILNLSPMHARSILNMDAGESDELLTELGDILTENKYAYYHHWKKDDVVVWDNWAVIHMATGVPPGVARGARRTTISGDYKLGRYLDLSLDASRYRETLPD